MLKHHAQTTCSNNMPKQHAQTSCSNNMPKHHAQTSCSHILSKHHAQTSCSNIMLKQHAQTTCSNIMPKHHAQTACPNIMLKYQLRHELQLKSFSKSPFPLFPPHMQLCPPQTSMMHSPKTPFPFGHDEQLCATCHLKRSRGGVCKFVFGLSSLWGADVVSRYISCD